MSASLRLVVSAAFGATLLSSGCRGEASPAVEAEYDRRDAVTAASDTVWTLAESPRFSIDRASSEPEGFLIQPSAGEFFDDGSFVIADGGTRRLIWLDPDGRVMHASGRRGDGPGEFRSLSAIFRPEGGRDVWVWDSALRRLSRYDGRGDFVSSRASPIGEPLPEAVLPGPIFVSTAPADRSASGRGRYVLRDDEGRVLAEHPASLTTRRPAVSVEFEGRTMNHGIPPGCVSDPGIVAIGPELLALDPAQGTVEAIARDGGRVVRHRVERREPVTDDARTAVEMMLERRFTIPGREAPDRVRRDAIEQLREAMGDTLPAWQDVVVDASGTLWLEVAECPRATDATTYRVLDLEDGRTGSVVVPDGLTVLAVRGRDVLVRRLDDLGIPHVEMYSLVTESSP